MPREFMQRDAADNRYHHPDFHGALSSALDYLARRFGPDAPADYLRQFTLGYYAPLRRRIREGGLAPLAEHWQQVYRAEGGSAEIDHDRAAETLTVRVAACPAVAHMRRCGYKVSDFWPQTTEAVNHALVEDTPYRFELVEFDADTGGGVQCFRRREDGGETAGGRSS
jgi:hypothetical protein